MSKSNFFKRIFAAAFYVFLLNSLRPEQIERPDSRNAEAAVSARADECQKGVAEKAFGHDAIADDAKAQCLDVDRNERGISHRSGNGRDYAADSDCRAARFFCFCRQRKNS